MKTLPKFFLLLACVIAAGPLVWHVVSSVKTSEELNVIPPTILPSEVSFGNYTELFERRPFLSYYRNSFIISALASIICVLCAAPAAYSLSRIPGRQRSVITSGLLLLAFFPPIVYLFPVYEIVRALHLVNHAWALILPYVALNLPFAIWFLNGYFRQIPNELEEAATLDGLGPFQTFFRIMLPLSTDALLSAGVLVFIFSWNEFMFALTFMNVEDSKTITVGLATLSGAFSVAIPWGLLAAGVVASSLPLILLVAIFQKRIVAGLTAGSLK